MIRRADVITHPGAVALGGHALRLAVTGHTQQADRAALMQAQRHLITDRQITVDTALDLLPLGLHGDALGYLQAAIALDL